MSTCSAPTPAQFAKHQQAVGKTTQTDEDKTRSRRPHHVPAGQYAFADSLGLIAVVEATHTIRRALLDRLNLG